MRKNTGAGIGGKPPLSPAERGGMLFLLAIGLLLMAGGWILVRKTGADDIPGFIQKATETWGTRYDNVVFFLLLPHLPWLAGLWLVVAMARRFLGKQDR